MIGKCLCGEIEFEIAGIIPNLYQCHCSQCRKQGGSASNSATIVNKKQFSWKFGENLVTQFKDKSGFNSHFCSVCGSPVPNKLGDSELVWIPAGALEDSEDLEIVAHLFVGSKAHWEKISNTGIQYEEMPSLDELINSLQRTSR
jgi:hypothetical protein